MNKLLANIISLLENSGFCDHSQILETALFSSDQFSFKIRTTIFSFYSFQIRIYYNKGHYDYSYQVFDKDPLCRWDNKEHFPNIKTYPHHFHSLTDTVTESSLKGNPVDDLKLVLQEIENIFNKK